MNADPHSDYLIMAIFVLGTMCLMRWTYLEIPGSSDDTVSYQQTREEKGVFPF